MLNNIAVRKVSIEKPGTRYSANKTKNTLIINKNKPKVSRVIGKVKNTRIGFIKVFNTPNTTAIIAAVTKESTNTPGIT